jgi:PTH1 family peptidyl-tRNA hydrolase
MELIIGLGNPGFRYKKTRHNAGFIALDYIQKNIGGFSKWKLNKKFQAEMSENPEANMLLAKPQTYMNKSGESVKSLVINYQLSVIDLFVIHDDFDLPIGTFKMEKEKGSAGHKGVQSIINSLGANNFWRLRIGIRPLNLGTKSLNRDLVPSKAENFVLKKFTREEKKLLERTIPEAVSALFNSPPFTKGD